MTIRKFVLAALCLAGLTIALAAQDAAQDPIVGTKWYGTLTSPTGPTPFGAEMRVNRRGTIVFVETMPAMHLYGQVTSRVTPKDGVYVLDDLPGTARIDGDTLRGVALYAKMPFELKRVDSIPGAPTEPSPTFPAPPAARWSRSLGAPAWAGPVARDGVLYLGTVDGHFHAVRASDGKDVWTWTDATPIYGNALVTADAVYFVNDRTELVRLNRNDGSLRWRVPLDATRHDAAQLPEDDTYNHRTATPVLAEGIVYVGSTDGAMVALDAANGRTRWRSNAGSKICAAATVAGDKLLFGTYDGSMIALHRADGHELWRTKLPAAIVSRPVVYGDIAIVGARDYALHSFRLRDGHEVWSQHYWASWVESEPRLVDGVMYIGSSDLRSVRAFDPHTGKVRWSTDVLGAAYGIPVVTADRVYIGVVGSAPYLIDEVPSIVALDRKTGAIRWRRSEAAVANSMSGHPGSLALVGQTIFAAGLDGSLVALPAR
jgi:outer membrane protein assembly factor BamB